MECKTIRITLGLAFTALLFLSSCYYDNYDDLAADTGVCDTVSMSYTMDIAPIMTQHCTSCHGGAAPAGNIPLVNYNDVKVAALNGSLLGTMDHASGWSAMPKNLPKLDVCTITKVNAWINQGVKK